MMTDHQLSLLAYNRWATEKVYDHLLELPASRWEQQITSVFPSLAQVCRHIYLIDRGWLQLLEGRHVWNDYDAIKTAIDVGIALVGQDSPLLLKQRHLELWTMLEARFRNMDDVPGNYAAMPMKPSEILLHMVNHGTYHRGNISAMLHQLGHAGTPTDYGLYLYTLTQ